MRFLTSSQRGSLRHRMRLETLEPRQLLTAANPLTPAVMGVISLDQNANGIVDAGEEIDGATVRLYEDTDDSGTFDENADTQIGVDAVTDANGEYCFDNLLVGETYFVVQIEQTVGGFELPEAVSDLVEPAAPTTLIDDFDLSQSISFSGVVGDSTSDTESTGSSALGSNRTISAEITSGSGTMSVEINPLGSRATMQFNPGVGVSGFASSRWDGLNSLDLTQNDATGISLLVGAQSAGANATIRLYADGVSGFSEASLPIDTTTGGVAETYMFMPFSSFSGPVNADDVDEFEVILDTSTVPANDIEIDVLGANGPRTFDVMNQPTVDLAVTKTDNQTTAVPGETLTYTVVVTNNGPNDVVDATIIDMFPSDLGTVDWTSVATGGATGNSTSGTGTSINDTVDMPSGSTITYTVTGQVASDATGSLQNVALVSAPNGYLDLDTSNNTAIDTDTLTPQVDLSVVKDDSVTTIVPGDSVTYSIIVRNDGPSDVVDATVVDQFPSELTNVTFTSAVTGTVTGNTASGNGNIFDIVSMRANSSITYTVTGQLSDSAIGQLTNTATVTAPSTVTETDTSDNSSTDTDTINVQADLEISKDDGITTIRPGATLTYNVVARNNGPSTVTGATITDVFPSQLTNVTYSSSTTGGATGNSSGSGNLSDTVTMPPGSTITYIVSATVSNSASGALDNTATITAPAGVNDTDLSNNSSQDVDTIVPEFDLTVSKTDGQSTAVPGESLTYTIEVSNEGPNDVNNATVVDSFPTEFQNPQFTSSTTGGASGNTTSGSGNINDTINLPANSSVTYSVTGTVDSAATGTLTNTVTVAAPAGVTENNTSNNTATDTDTLDPEFDLQITKTNNTESVIAGESISYSIEVNNNGPSDATGVTIVDTFPSSIRDVSYTSTSQNGATGNTTSGAGSINDTVDMPAGSSVIYTVNATVDETATGTITNVTTVTGPNGEINTTNNSSSETDEVAVVLRQISGSVFVDSNQNGERDNNESPISGVEITLTGTNRTGATINRTDLTDASGVYLFEDLLPGTYTIQETQPDGFLDGQEDAGSGSVGNPTVADDVFSNITLGNDNDVVDFDFGEILVRPSKRNLLASAF